MAEFKASRNWPHYNGPARFFDKQTGQFSEVKNGKLVPVQNEMAAAHKPAPQAVPKRKR